MSDGAHRISACRRLPVFRLISTNAAIAQDFGRSLAGEIAGRGLRLLVVRFPAAGVPATAVAPFPGDTAIPAADRPDGGESFSVSHLEVVDAGHALSLLTDLALHHDLVLVDGDCGLPLNTVRLATTAALETDEGDTADLRTVDPRQGTAACADLLLSWLDEIWRAVPVWACVLIGGRSSRMGRPKHLLEKAGGRTWLEDTVDVLRPHVERVVLAGRGEIPSSLQDLTRIADAPGLVGPLSGILAAMRWQPDVTWLLVACDMPSLTSSALHWLLEERRPGRWAVIPRRKADIYVEPLFACYDRRCRTLFEELRLSGSLRIGMIAHKIDVYHPVIPEPFLHAWDNINTPSEFEQYCDDCGINREQAGEG
ncbi:molybdenum cofactor guanylyltransferase [Desulfoprunum benzoelyticum]|uniref:Molybdopterin-guanine dinucleotide biosynthesis protein A n=1 Tax=Desulfoprunum benzoelyticum TaxID=1506996 RepID=A0A840USF3_9BACT|nr:molybdenum cofactor guanylyltransferase [Desulfoprunum benzoelyticum]MBB5347643.1 molybdopterin-guanine dinucleotide biosynthesis protein A [Desulfoprunum benzoelyticum]MBM9529229.1 molybdenum cofactor guanylyltransferase [Desulfoprunum benzoelyticum]